MFPLRLLPAEDVQPAWQGEKKVVPEEVSQSGLKTRVVQWQAELQFALRENLNKPNFKIYLK